jgi:RNA polymerase sigma factor (sigma-70 family)
MTPRPSIAKLKSGDSDAWAWFFSEFSGQIAGYARRMGVTDPEDVTGTVLETVARSVGGFSGSHSQFRSWVFSIAHARIVDDHRRRDRRPEVAFTESHDRTQNDVDALVVSGDPGLEVAMKQLTEDQRSLLHLRFVLELSTREIAKVTDKSEVATRVALHRCQKRLRELLDAERTLEAAES